MSARRSLLCALCPARPSLLCALCVCARAPHALAHRLQTDIEAYKSSFLQGTAAAPSPVAAADKSGYSPAAMGRHKIDPLPSPSFPTADKRF